MLEFTLNNLALILGLIVPGLVASYVRAQFLTGRSPPHNEAILSYLVITVIYYALVFPALRSSILTRSPSYVEGIIWFGLIFIGPAAFGLVLGIIARKDLVRRLGRICGLDTVHGIPTAWDWKFSNTPEQWVLVTLTDGTMYAGYCGTRSFMSSDPMERDIYVERIYDLDEDNTWVARGENGVLIPHGQIRTIEFWPVTSEENNYGEK